MTTKHLKKEIQKGMYIVQLLFAKNHEDKDAYFYVSVRGDKIEDFKKAISKGNCDISNFGSILEHGVGIPNELTRIQMEEKYGFDHSDINFKIN